jgi:hypothetical protein
MAKEINFTQVMGTLGTVAAVAGAVALLWKVLSPGQRCPRCDTVLRAVNAFNAVCPGCSRSVVRT